MNNDDDVDDNDDDDDNNNDDDNSNYLNLLHLTYYTQKSFSTRPSQLVPRFAGVFARISPGDISDH